MSIFFLCEIRWQFPFFIIGSCNGDVLYSHDMWLLNSLFSAYLLIPTKKNIYPNHLSSNMVLWKDKWQKNTINFDDNIPFMAVAIFQTNGHSGRCCFTQWSPPIWTMFAGLFVSGGEDTAVWLVVLTILQQWLSWNKKRQNF